MGYANPKQRITYSFGLIDFSSASSTRVRGPKGMQGRIIDISVGGNTLFTNVTTPAHIKLGTATTAAAYVDATLGALAADAAWTMSNDQPTAMTAASLPADTDVKIAFVAPTGGSPAGKGFVSAVIDWF